MNYLYAFLIGMMTAILLTHPRHPVIDYGQFADMVFHVADNGLLLVRDKRIYTIHLVEE